MDGCPLIVLKEEARREVYDIVVAGEGEGAVAAAKGPVNSINTGTIVKTLAVRHIN